MAETVREAGVTLPTIRQIDADEPWRWLSAGWADLRRAPAASLSYGLIVAIIGWIITAAIWVFDQFYLVLPLVAGFLLFGPIAAVGLYDLSRRMEEGKAPSLASAIFAFRANFVQLALMGLVLVLFMLAWVDIAIIIFMGFFSDNPPRPEPMFLLDVFFSEDSIPFLVVGTAIGGGLAATVFAIGAVSVPALVDRRINVITAIITSFEAVRRNFWAMALWAWLIVVFVAAGLVTGYLGLIITLPLIGHATWHAYKSIIQWDRESRPSKKETDHQA